MFKSVSIIIPALNEEKYISQCLNAISLLEVGNLKIQTIVVDNGSSDNTVKIAKTLGAEVIIKSGVNISELRNIGAEKSKGDLLAFVDADCIVSENWLRNAVKGLNGDIGAIGSRPVAPAESSTWVQECWGKIMPRSLEGSLSVDWLSSSNMIVRKELFDKVNGFNEQLQTYEDVDLGLRLNKVTKILYDPNVKAFHLREPKTLFALFKKQIWYGRGLYKNIFQHGLIFRDLKIIGIPLFCLINIFMIIIGLSVRNDIWVISTILFFSIPITMTIRNLRRIKNPIILCQCFFINTAFIFGRSVSIIFSLIDLLRNK